MPSSEDSPTPRQIRSAVTQEALSVDPGVIGLPLARPWRRAAAFSIDGVIVALLTSTPSVLFGFAAAAVLFRASRRKAPGGGYLKRSFRFMFRVGGAMVLFGVAVSLWGSIRDRFSGDGSGRTVAVARSGEGEASLEISGGMEAARFAGEVISLHRSDDEEGARAATQRLLDRMHASGVEGADAREAVRSLAGDVEEKPWVDAAVQTVLAYDEAAQALEPVPAEDAIAADSLVVAYSAALAEGDTVAADSLRPMLVTVLSAEPVSELERQIDELDDERDELSSRVGELEEEVEEGPGLLAFIRSFAEDLGLGLGWFGLYFTATTALWQGRTPGKRLLGIRVIRLTGKPIGWWASFERAGGYAAGLATGLLGFLQLLWDDNRQAIHDKIAATTVIRD
jgi:uncharacterized RDD family membrane protein YckC